MVKFPKIKWGRGEWTFCAAVRMLTFFGGVVVSSAVSYHYAENKFRKDYDQQLKEVKAFYKNRSEEDDLKDKLLKKEYVQTAKPVAKDAMYVTVEKEDDIPEHHQEVLQRYGAKQVNDISQAGQRFPDENDDRIRIITQSEYFDTDSGWEHHDKIALLYYEVDEVVVNPLEPDDDEIVEDFEKLLGTEFTYNFANYGGGGRAYVRNTKIGVDYEIELIPESYEASLQDSYESDLRTSPRLEKDD